MNIYKLLSKCFLPLVVGILAIVGATSCADDDEELMQSGYGYVQFKLTKVSSSEGAASRAETDRLENLSDAKKLQVMLLHDGTTVSQTLILNSYNDENAEFGLRSDKLQLVAGAYKVVGFYLYDALDELLYTGGSGENSDFTVVGGGLHVQNLSAEAKSNGLVRFRLTKEIKSRATEEGYLFSSIAEVDIQVKNMFTREVTTFEKLKVTYETEYEESSTEDNPDDKYKELGTATTDSLVWLPAGTYQVVSYSTFSRSGATRKELETQVVVNGKSFVVTDNAVTEDAPVPIQLSETSENIKDYRALYEIWKKMGGKDWSYFGVEYPEGTNWNFNKELDLWGEQPGVTLGTNGRVTGLVLSGFGASGFLPDAVGQLTELQILALGSHDEQVGGKLFSSEGITVGMSEERKQKMRRHYEEMYLKHDIREGFSDMLQAEINSNPKKSRIVKSGRISPKDTQIGATTNKVEGISKAVMRLTKLQQLYIANSPVLSENICANWEDPESEYAKAYQQEIDEGTLDWSNMEELTDIEIYNCKNMTQLPTFLYKLPEIQLLNIACNRGISAQQLKDDWTRLATEETTGPKVQILYMGYNNLEEFPEGLADGNVTGAEAGNGPLCNMKKLVLLDLTDNKVKKVSAFGTDIKLVTLYLQNNQIEDIPANFCGFTNEVETFNFSNNKLTVIPNIFDAESRYIMGSLDFSNNQITGVEDPDNFKGINANTVSLANNRFETFPKEIFSAGSPITELNMSGNLLTEIPKGSLQGKNAHLLETFDLRFNKLTKLSEDFRSTTLPYISGLDLSYNCFSEVPADALNPATLRAFAIRHQRDAKGERCLRTWPVGITKCPSMYYFQIGSNDIRLVDETMTPYIYYLDIADNPNITIDLSSVCSAISQGLYYLFYDKTQDIRGCDILFD